MFTPVSVSVPVVSVSPLVPVPLMTPANVSAAFVSVSVLPAPRTTLLFATPVSEMMDVPAVVAEMSNVPAAFATFTLADCEMLPPPERASVPASIRVMPL